MLGAEHPDTLVSVNNLAGLLESKGDYGAAEPLYRRAAEAAKRVLGAKHPHTLTFSENLARLLAMRRSPPSTLLRRLTRFFRGARASSGKERP